MSHLVVRRKSHNNMHTNVEKITPYGGAENKGVQIEHAFDSIAPCYDSMNRLLSVGIDIFWRKRAIRSIATLEPSNIIDLASGTGDLAIMAARQFPDATITGVDLSQEMLSIAGRKAEKNRLSERITFQQADCLDLPFENNSFDLATIGFGIRNFESLCDGCKEMLRVLRPRGKLVILELSRPQNRVLSGFYHFYLTKVTPLWGKLFTGKTFEYAYLQRSIDCVPQGQDMLKLLRDAGFQKCTSKTYTFGVCSCYTAVKG